MTKLLVVSAIFVLAGWIYLGGQIGKADVQSMPKPTQPSVTMPKPATLPVTTSNQLILTVSGSGDTLLGMSTKTSQTFHISKNEWYIKSTCESLDISHSPLLAISVFPKGKTVESGDIVGLVSQTSPGIETNYVHKSGDFYLSIVAMNIKNWTIEIYE